MSFSRTIETAWGDITSPDPAVYMDAVWYQLQEAKRMKFLARVKEGRESMKGRHERKRRTEGTVQMDQEAGELTLKTAEETWPFEAQPAELRSKIWAGVDSQADLINLAVGNPADIPTICKEYCSRIPMAEFATSSDYRKGKEILTYKDDVLGQGMEWCQAWTYVLDLSKIRNHSQTAWVANGLPSKDSPNHAGLGEITAPNLSSVHIIMKPTESSFQDTPRNICLMGEIGRMMSRELPVCSAVAAEGGKAFDGFRTVFDELSDFECELRRCDTVLFEIDADAPLVDREAMFPSSHYRQGLGARHAVIKLRNSKTAGFGEDDATRAQFAECVAMLTYYANARGTHVTIVSPWDADTTQSLRESIIPYISEARTDMDLITFDRNPHVTSLGWMTPDQAKDHDFSAERWGRHPEAC